MPPTNSEKQSSRRYSTKVDTARFTPLLRRKHAYAALRPAYYPIIVCRQSRLSFSATTATIKYNNNNNNNSSDQPVCPPLPCSSDQTSASRFVRARQPGTGSVIFIYRLNFPNFGKLQRSQNGTSLSKSMMIQPGTQAFQVS